MIILLENNLHNVFFNNFVAEQTNEAQSLFECFVFSFQLRAQNQVLKKAVVDEQEKNSQLSVSYHVMVIQIHTQK